MPTYEKLKLEAKNYKVYLKSDFPKHLHYGASDDKTNRAGDILLVPDWPKVFHFSSRRPNPGAHGYDPYTLKDMHAIFLAWGPAFKNGITVPAFENVNVFPVVTRILGLNFSHKIDGTKKLADTILK
jgi:hypothetical protein